MPEPAVDTAALPTDPLPALLAPVETAVGRALETLLDDLERDLFAPLREHIRAAAARHQQLATTHGLAEPDAPSADPDAPPSERLRAYRRAVRDAILEPLCDHLASMEPAGVAERWQATREALPAEADALPREKTRPEPPGLFDARPGDRPWWRLAKTRVRAARRLEALRRRGADRAGRLVGRAPRPLPPPVQQVPLRHLVHFHLAARLPNALVPLLPEVHRALARPVALLEHALTTWTHALLRDARELASAGAELPEEARVLLPNVEPAVPDGAVPLADVRMQAGLLQRHLEEAAALASTEALREPVRGAHAAGWATLLLDVDRADTFMLREEDRALPPDVDESVPRDEHWVRWHDEAADRLRLNAALLRYDVSLDRVRAAYVGGVAGEGLVPVLRLHAAAEEALQALHAEAAAGLGARETLTLHEALAALRDQALQSVEERLLEPLRALPHEAVLHEVAADAIRAWSEAAREVPAVLHVHPLPPPGEPVEPDAPRRELRPREVVEQALDALLLERLRTAVAPLGAVFDEVLAEAESVPGIVRFNLEAAADELPEDGAVDEATHADARELALNGLARPAEVITGLRCSVGEAVPAFLEATDATFATGWTRVYERLRVEDRVQEQLMDLRSRLRGAALRSAHRLRERRGQTGALGRRLFRLGRRRAGELVRLGQTAVGAAAVTEAERHRTLRALADAEALVGHFPLVYRRLFSFHPVADAALLAGREDDLERVRLHVGHWTQRLAGALVLTGPRDAGMTSFLHAVETQALQDAAVHRLTLTDRVRTEAAFAAEIARVLDMPEPVPPTLNALAERLAERGRPTRPEAVIVEHLEHLYLRVVEGTRLLEAVLTFMSRTDADLLWIGTLTDQGGRFVRQTEPASAGLVRWHALPPLGRRGLEEMIMQRHRRSGLPLAFEASDETRALLRRRLRRAHTEEDRQALLRQAYFDRLHRLTGHSLTLALFYWLRSAELDAEHNRLIVRPFAPLQLPFLVDFDLDQAFTLKAFLDHTTLTLAEHAEIFRTPLDDSRQRFEALSNVLLIEACGGGGGARPSIGPAITETDRYRLRPLTVYPLTQYLARRHITY